MVAGTLLYLFTAFGLADDNFAFSRLDGCSPSLVRSFLCSPPSKVATAKIFVVQGADSPKMSFTIGTATGFDETIVEGKIMSNAVSPTSSLVSKVGKMAQNVIVDVAKDQLLFRRAKDCFCDESNV